MTDFNPTKSILKLRSCSRQSAECQVALLFFNNCENNLSKGVNILLEQPVFMTRLSVCLLTSTLWNNVIHIMQHACMSPKGETRFGLKIGKKLFQCYYLILLQTLIMQDFIMGEWLAVCPYLENWIFFFLLFFFFNHIIMNITLY